MKSTVAGNPKDSEVSSKPISVLLKPCLVVCVAEIIGKLYSTARPLSSSAIDLINVYELILAPALNLCDAHIFK